MELCTLAVCVGLAAFTVYAAAYSVFFIYPNFVNMTSCYGIVLRVGLYGTVLLVGVYGIVLRVGLYGIVGVDAIDPRF